MTDELFLEIKSDPTLYCIFVVSLYVLGRGNVKSQLPPIEDLVGEFSDEVFRDAMAFALSLENENELAGRVAMFIRDEVLQVRRVDL